MVNAGNSGKVPKGKGGEFYTQLPKKRVVVLARTLRRVRRAFICREKGKET